MPNRRAFLLLLSAGLAACAPMSVGTVRVPPDTRLILLRHADRDGEDLNERGIERSKTLVKALSGVPIDAIYVRDMRRNVDTAQPLARNRGLPVRRMSDTDAAARLVQLGAGKSIVWIGNTDNLSEIWAALGTPGEPPTEYGDLFFVDGDPSGTPRVERRHFGP